MHPNTIIKNLESFVKKTPEKIINLSISFGKTTKIQNQIKTIYAELF